MMMTTEKQIMNEALRRAIRRLHSPLDWPLRVGFIRDTNLNEYSVQQKLDSINAYRSGDLGLRATTALHNVDAASLRKWVAVLETLGIAGIQKKWRHRLGQLHHQIIDGGKFALQKLAVIVATKAALNAPLSR